MIELWLNVSGLREKSRLSPGARKLSELNSCYVFQNACIEPLRKGPVHYFFFSFSCARFKLKEGKKKRYICFLSSGLWMILGSGGHPHLFF